MALCKACGRIVGATGFSIEPNEKIPEIRKTAHFCGERCMNAYLGRIKAKYTKQTKREVRKALEQADRKPDDKDLVAIYQTLTEKEKFIMFPDISSTGLSSEEFATQLFQKHNVAVVPGSVFGAGGEGHIRCCYATAVDKIKIALDKIAEFVQECKANT